MTLEQPFSKIRRRLIKKPLRLLSPRCSQRILSASVWRSTSPSSTTRSSTRPRRFANSPRQQVQAAVLLRRATHQLHHPILRRHRNIRQQARRTRPRLLNIHPVHRSTVQHHRAILRQARNIPLLLLNIHQHLHNINRVPLNTRRPSIVRRNHNES